MDAKTAVEILRGKCISEFSLVKPIRISVMEEIIELIEQQEKEIVGLIDDNGQQHIEIMLLTRKNKEQENLL